MTQALFLVASDHGSRKAAVANPGIDVRPRVTPRHPSQELPEGTVSQLPREKLYGNGPVINDEVGENKLMGIEDEGRDAERQDGNPEIEQVRGPGCEGDV